MEVLAVGQFWLKGSFPAPTVVEIVELDKKRVRVKHGTSRYWMTRGFFMAQFPVRIQKMEKA